MSKYWIWTVFAVMTAACLGVAADRTNERDDRRSENSRSARANPDRSRDDERSGSGARSRDDERGGRSESSGANGSERSIRRVTARLVEAYNRQDARELADYFTDNAEMLDQNGDLYQGREEIEEAFAEQFEDEPTEKVTAKVDSVRFLNSSLAVADGRFELAEDDRATEPSPLSRFTLLYVREGDEWRVASARDQSELAPPDSPHEYLRQLEWMVGDWVDESPDVVVRTSCRWAEDGNFLLRKYSVEQEGEPTLRATQRIGWCALTGRLKSWTFDSEGGESTGYWHRKDDQWVLKLDGVSADGDACSALQIYTPVNDHTYTWRAIYRTEAGEALPDLDEVKIVRAAPKPLSMRDSSERESAQRDSQRRDSERREQGASRREASDDRPSRR